MKQGYHHHTLLVDYDTRVAIDAWCEQHMRGNWYCRAYAKNYGPTPPTWYFAAERDYLLFLLKWAS